MLVVAVCTDFGIRSFCLQTVTQFVDLRTETYVRKYTTLIVLRVSVSLSLSPSLSLGLLDSKISFVAVSEHVKYLIAQPTTKYKHYSLDPLRDDVSSLIRGVPSSKLDWCSWCPDRRLC